MFDFQKEVIINVGDENKMGKTADGFRIDGMNYKTKYVGTIYKTPAVDGSKATLTLPLANIKSVVTNLAQFVIELGLDNDYRGDFGSALYYFRKPVMVTLDASTLDEADVVAKAFEKAGVAGEKLYTVTSGEGTVTLTMNDNYITVRSAKVFDIQCKEGCGEMMEVPVEVVTWETLKENYTPNKVGFGTYEYMIHNLRLPTYANIRFASPAEVEMPVKGGKYNQYSFEYTVPRRLGGLSVAGQKTESTTIHTFFVLDTIDSAFRMATGINDNFTLVSNVRKTGDGHTHADLAE